MPAISRSAGDKTVAGRHLALNRRLSVVPVASVTLATPGSHEPPTARQWGLAVSADQNDERRGCESPEVVSLLVAPDADIRNADGALRSLEGIAGGDVVEWIAESQDGVWVARQLSVTSGPLPDGDTRASAETG